MTITASILTTVLGKSRYHHIFSRWKQIQKSSLKKRRRRMYGLSVCVWGGSAGKGTYCQGWWSECTCVLTRTWHARGTHALPPHLLFIISKGRGRVQVDLRAHTSTLLPCCRSLRPHTLREVTAQRKNSFSWIFSLKNCSYRQMCLFTHL